MNNHRTVLTIAMAGVVSLFAATPAFAGVIARVPEPGTMTLIGTGVVALAAGAWWRNRK